MFYSRGDMKILLILLISLASFSQEILEVRGENVFISNRDLELTPGKKYIIETQSGPAEIGVYKNSDKSNGYVAKVLSGNINKADYISKVMVKTTKTKTTTRTKYRTVNRNKNFYWGAHLGVNSLSTEIIDTSNNDQVISETDSSLGFQLGLNAQYYFNSKWALNAKISYNSLRTSAETGSGVSRVEEETAISTVTIQPQIKFYPIDQLFVQLGLRAGFFTGFTVNEDQGGVSLPEEDWLDDTFVESNYGARVNKFGLDIPLGVGGSFKLESMIIEPNITFYIPLGPLVEGVQGNPLEVNYTNFAFNIDFLF